MAGIKRRQRKGVTGSFALLVAVFCLALGTSVGLYLMPAMTPASLAPVVAPTSARVEEQLYVDEYTSAVTLRVDEPVALSTSASGRVTWSALSAPGTIKSGTLVLSVNLMPVFALHTDIPLFRDLKTGDRGQDVAALNRELVRLKYLKSNEGDRFSYATQMAWMALQRNHSTVKASRSLAVSAILWLPTLKVAVAKWMATVGSAIPADGVVGQTRRHLVAISIEAETLRKLLPGRRTVSLFGVQTEVADAGRIDDSAFLKKVENTQSYADAMSGAEPEGVTATISLVQGVSILRVPVGALFGVVEKLACIQVGSDSIPVTIIGSNPGAALITPDDGSQPQSVAIGSGLTATGCTR